MSWPSDYEVQAAPELSGSGDRPIRFEPGVGRAQGFLLVRVSLPHGTWIGEFSGGDGKLDGAYQTPSPRHVCVVSRGQGYWVNVIDPNDYELVRAYPVRSVHRVASPPLLLLIDDTCIVAYGETGERWITPRLASDGVDIVRAEESGIVGRAWDAALNRNVGFFIDVRTGQIEGGMVQE